MFLVSIAFFYSLIICALYDVYMYSYKVNKDYYYYVICSCKRGEIILVLLLSSLRLK